MVSNSKVLTVSYGTFSCTLEGFEDSFDTMKSIAEYFRDLATDDRYFGAEPPKPDAEVLAAIAQKELSRQVTGRAQGNAITLSASPTTDDAPQQDTTLIEKIATPKTVQKTQKETNPSDETVIKKDPILQVSKPVITPETEHTETEQVKPEQTDTDSKANIETIAQETLQESPVAEALHETKADTVAKEIEQKNTVPVVEVKPEVLQKADKDQIDPVQASETNKKESPAPEPQFTMEPIPPVKRAPRVIKVRKADLEKAMTDDGAIDLEMLAKNSENPAPLDITQPSSHEDIKPEDLPTNIAPAEQPIVDDLNGLSDFIGENKTAPLSPEGDAALLATLAKVDTQTQALPSEKGKASDTVSVGRILNQTNEVMSDPQQQARHETYNQMKAAVTIKESLDETAEPEQQENTYRNEFAKIVNDSSPDSKSPLQLVASQRIDKTNDATPQRVKRVQPQNALKTPDLTGMDFQQYLSHVNATELSDILEAAAAYTAFVENGGAFSRPQVMLKVSQVMNDDFNREDCLRVFGGLLRKGTLKRHTGGRFIMDENSKYQELLQSVG